MTSIRIYLIKRFRNTIFLNVYILGERHLQYLGDTTILLGHIAFIAIANIVLMKAYEAKALTSMIHKLSYGPEIQKHRTSAKILVTLWLMQF